MDLYENYDFYTNYELILPEDFYINKTHAIYNFEHSAPLIALANCFRLSDNILTNNRFSFKFADKEYLKFRLLINKLWNNDRVILNPKFKTMSNNIEFLKYFLNVLNNQTSHKIIVNSKKLLDSQNNKLIEYINEYANHINGKYSIINQLFNVCIKDGSKFIFNFYLELSEPDLETGLQNYKNKIWNCPEYLIVIGNFNNFPLVNLHLEDYLCKDKDDFNTYIYDCTSIIYNDSSVSFKTYNSNWFIHDKNGISFLNTYNSNKNIYDDSVILIYSRKFIKH